MAEYCTLADVKLRADIAPTDTSWDAQIADWIEAASDLAEEYCAGRRLGPDLDASTRIFTIGDTIDVAIDDLSAAPTTVVLRDEYGNLIRDVTADTLTVPRNLPAGEYKPITALTFRPSVPLQPGWELHVTGKWGFRAVPSFVKDAVADTVREWLRGVQGVTQDAPDVPEPGYPQNRAMPLRARQMLDRIEDWTVPA